MAARVLILCLAALVAAPLNAMCAATLKLAGQKQAAPDCCDKRCPKPLKAGTCLDCFVADRSIPPSGERTDDAVILPQLPDGLAFLATTPVTSCERDLFLDHGGTYLRIGVLRL